MENPILFEPVIFDDPPPGFGPPPPEDLERALLAEREKSLTPSFCTVKAEGHSLSAGHHTSPVSLHTSQPLPIEPAMPQENQPQVSAANTAVVSIRDRKLNAYDVAEALRRQMKLWIHNEILYAFDGHVYRHLTQSNMERSIVQLCRKDVRTAGTPTFVKQVYSFLRQEPEIVWNGPFGDDNLVAFENCVLNIETGESLHFSPQLMVTTQVKAIFEPRLFGQCPMFNSFLGQVTGGDPTLIQRIWEIIGCCLAPKAGEKAFFLLQGVPDSGKSLLGKLISSFFDESSCTSLDFNDLGRQFGPVELLGKRICTCLDLPATPWDAKAIGTLKRFTGGDPFTADVKYNPAVTFTCKATFIFASNHQVWLTARDDGLMRRLVVVPFNFGIPKQQQNPQLLSLLESERNAIATTAVLAYQQMCQRKDGFAGNYALNNVVGVDDPRATQDIESLLLDFICQHIEFDSNASEFSETLHQAFVQYYHIQIDKITFSAKFYRLLLANYPGPVTKCRTHQPGASNATNAYKGIRLVRDSAPSRTDTIV